MKNKGFTLIELLAVIVILAIIALIATPIILNIIDSSREESGKRSVEMYASAIKNAVARHKLNGGGSVSGKFTPNGKTIKNDTVILNVDYDNSEVICETIEIYEDGNIYLDICKINNQDIDYVYGTQQPTSANVCVPVKSATLGTIPKGNYVAGDEYICDPGDGIKRTFYVLNKSGSYINLIMGSNLTESPWISKSDYLLNNGDESKWTDSEYDGCVWGDNPYSNTSMGPLTAFNTMNSITSRWKHITDLNETYTDLNRLYTINLTGNARLPKYSEINGLGCLVGWGNEETCPKWLAGNYWMMDTYHTVSPDYEYCGYGFLVYTSTMSEEGDAYGIEESNVYSNYGIRPVIKLHKDKIA